MPYLPKRMFHPVIGLMVIITMFPAVASGQFDPELHFDRTWARADGPIAAGVVERTWVWGPTKYGAAIYEDYSDSLDGERLVQYFDKSRMEITHPGGDPNSPWYVTNGLLVVELITGAMQIGDSEFQQRDPAEINIAGDMNDPNGPTYAAFGELLDAPATPSGWLITARIDREGNVHNEPDIYGTYGVTATASDDVTGHSIAQPFVEFMHATGQIWDGSAYVTGSLFPDPLFALGRPITEPYWAHVAVAGTVQDVLLQCFERRCVTYAPANPEGWRVEAGNVGRHYYNWRYDGVEPVDPIPAEPEPTQPPVTETPVPPDIDPTPEPEPTVPGVPLPPDIGHPPSGGGSGQHGQVICEDFTWQEEAQQYFDERGGIGGGAQHLDADNDGIPCEHLPSRSSGGGGGGGGGPIPPARPH